MRGGKREGAGRKKNVPNRASARREQMVAASGATPLDVMLTSMRMFVTLAEEHVKSSKQYEHFIRAAASVAKDVAPYVHPKLSTTEGIGPAHADVKHEIEVVGGLPFGSTADNPGGTVKPEDKE